MDHQKSKRVPEKHQFLLYWLHQSLWLCGWQQSVENSERDGTIRPPDLPPEKYVCPDFWTEKSVQLELDMEQQTGSKLGKEYVKAAYCHPAYLTSRQSTSWETPSCIMRRLESRLPGEISITSDTQMTHPYGRKRRRTKEPLENERGEWKSWLKTQHSGN